MKKYFGLQKVILALTTLTLVGLSSCRDQDFDWDEAYATEQYQKFDNVFFKSYGKPQEGHEWGFDLANFAINGTLPATTRGYFKYSTNWADLDKLCAPKPAPITEREHQEVYAWFSTHRVSWVHNPSYVQVPRTNQLLPSTAKYTPNNLITLKDQGKFDCFVDDRSLKMDDIEAYKALGSLTKYSNNNATSDATIGTRIKFSNGWVQRVASNVRENDEMKNALCDYSTSPETVSEFYTTGGQIYYLLQNGEYVRVDKNMHVLYKYKGSYYMKKGDEWTYSDSNANQGNSVTDSDLISNLNSSAEKVTSKMENTNPYLACKSGLNKAGQMNYMYAMDLTYDQSNHLNDFNATSGYGYNNEGDQYIVTNADLNYWRYQNSTGSTLGDKYIIVYLEGDGYSGYYLGFDYESWASSDEPYNRIMADGYCNDWIIKIGEIKPGGSDFSSCRLMCEDLGGDYGNSTTDIDYNDIVLDVNVEKTTTVDSKTEEVVTLTLQAAGGTLPLRVSYGDYPLFETHEFFQKGAVWSSAGAKTDVNYRLMYNTGHETSGAVATPKVYRLYFNKDIPSNDSSAGSKTFTGSFDLNELTFHIYSLGTDDYVSNPSNLSEAFWINLENQYESAPLKLCVPQTVYWLLERHKIDDGYGNFRDWVQSADKYFWADGKQIDPNHLYHGGSNQ